MFGGPINPAWQDLKKIQQDLFAAHLSGNTEGIGFNPNLLILVLLL